MCERLSRRVNYRTILQYLWGGMERAVLTQQMPQHRPQISERSNMFLRHSEEGKFLIHCPARHTSLFLYSSPIDNSSLSQAVIVPHLCQLVAQILSFLVGFQTPLQRRRGWEFGRGLILILTAQSQHLQTRSPRPRPDARGGTNTLSSRGKLFLVGT